MENILLQLSSLCLHQKTKYKYRWPKSIFMLIWQSEATFSSVCAEICSWAAVSCLIEMVIDIFSQQKCWLHTSHTDNINDGFVQFSFPWRLFHWISLNNFKPWKDTLKWAAVIYLNTNYTYVFFRKVSKCLLCLLQLSFTYCIQCSHLSKTTCD